MIKITILLFFVLSSTLACPYVWEPVCAKSGKTYSNACFASEAQDEVLYKGACPEKRKRTFLNYNGCMCIAIYDPVCTKSGKTYSNECMANCHGEKVFTKGACKVEKKIKKFSSCICPAVYDPVCGKSGKTYSNDCAASCEGDIVVSKGACVERKTRKYSMCMCTEEYAPVCGKSGSTHVNECFARCAFDEIVKKGECEMNSYKKKECVCTKEFNPVCTKSGKSFANKCLAACENEVVVKGGFCEETTLSSAYSMKKKVTQKLNSKFRIKQGETIEFEDGFKITYNGLRNEKNGSLSVFFTYVVPHTKTTAQKAIQLPAKETIFHMYAYEFTLLKKGDSYLDLQINLYL